MAKIAIVGTGISGLGAAYLLNPHHEITVYEKADRIGGHSRTLTVDYQGKKIPVDTGFIVFNPNNYPHLSAMFRHLGVKVHKSDMTFSATIDDGWLEWGAKNLDSVFGQRRNLLRPRFSKMVRDVLHFNANALETVERHPHLTLDGLMTRMELGDWFRRYYLLPMSGAIWSCPPCEMMTFPAATLVRFFANHQLLSASGQPQWYTVTGGAQEYVKTLTKSFAPRIRTSCAAAQVTRRNGKVQVRSAQGDWQEFDQIVLAGHANEMLTLLGDASAEERNLLSCFRYQKNRAILHRDESVMPRRKRCWASWVYSSDGASNDPAISVTYWMNRLQGIDDAYPLFVTLNPLRPIDPARTFDEHVFDHPVFDHAAVAAQRQIAGLQGVRGTWFCGAHLRHGFHEDGLSSAVAVAEKMGIRAPWTVQLPDSHPAPVRRPQRTPFGNAPKAALAAGNG